MRSEISTILMESLERQTGLTEAQLLSAYTLSDMRKTKLFDEKNRLLRTVNWFVLGLFSVFRKDFWHSRRFRNHYAKLGLPVSSRGNIYLSSGRVITRAEIDKMWRKL